MVDLAQYVLFELTKEKAFCFQLSRWIWEMMQWLSFWIQISVLEKVLTECAAGFVSSKSTLALSVHIIAYHQNLVCGNLKDMVKVNLSICSAHLHTLSVITITSQVGMSSNVCEAVLDYDFHLWLLSVLSHLSKKTLQHRTEPSEPRWPPSLQLQMFVPDRSFLICDAAYFVCF